MPPKSKFPIEGISFYSIARVSW